MRTTIIIEDTLFEMIKKVTGAKTKTEAVNCALREYLRLKAKDELLNLRGNLELEDNWQDLREGEKHEN